MLKLHGDELVPMVPEEVADAAAELRSLRAAQNGYEVAAAVSGIPDDPAALEAAGATWVLVTGWLDDLPGIVAAGPPS